MIDESEIIKAVGQVIVASAAFPRIVWGNAGAIPARPYLVLTLVPTGMTDPTLARSAGVWNGFLAAAVVTQLDEFETLGRAQVKALGDLFPAGTRLTMDSGKLLLVPNHPQTLPAYRDGADYRHPVRIGLQTDSI